jgi:hypothetical protein
MAGKKARARKQKSRSRDTNAANGVEAIPGLPNHLVVADILRSEYFDDPADLARLLEVSRAMRDALSATGLAFEELDEVDAAELGCLSAVKRLQRGGRLSRREYLCHAAARSGQLEELKVLRTDGWPWDQDACSAAALGGHLEMLQWARANGCPWDKKTCDNAAGGGLLKVPLWARKNGYPCDENELHVTALNGQVAKVRALIELGAHVNKAVKRLQRGGRLSRQEYLCHAAASDGKLEELKVLRADGWPWDSYTCASAAAGGHLEVLQWTRANG